MISTFLKDGEGDFSFQRLQAFLVQTTILGVWAYISYKNGEMMPIPEGLTELSGLSLASLVAGKINETVKAVKGPSSGVPAV